MLDKDRIYVLNTQTHQAAAVAKVVQAAYYVKPEEIGSCDVCMQASDILAQVRQFPEGQFVAMMNGEVVGMAATMRTKRPPTAPRLRWLDAIGGLAARNHDPDGDWLYGIEVAVLPDCRGRGIGVRMYEARFDLVKRLNLRGWYAGGMLMGYHRYKNQMSVRDYAEKVATRQIIDPTVTMQMNRGFRLGGVIEDYLPEEWAGNAAMTIIWDNPDYVPAETRETMRG